MTCCGPFLTIVWTIVWAPCSWADYRLDYRLGTLFLRWLSFGRLAPAPALAGRIKSLGGIAAPFLAKHEALARTLSKDFMQIHSNSTVSSPNSQKMNFLFFSGENGQIQEICFFFFEFLFFSRWITWFQSFSLFFVLWYPTIVWLSFDYRLTIVWLSFDYRLGDFFLI